MLVIHRVVLGQQIRAKVVAGVAPDGVDVVGVVLRVVVFYQEARSLQAIVVGLASL